MAKLFLDETKEKMKKNNTRSNQKGVSMITLVITIIVLLILLAFTFGYSGNSINEASRAEFFQEVSLVEQQSSEKRFANQIYGTGEVIENKGFYKTKIKNPPEDFVSFSEDAIYGYVVDLEYIEFDDEAKRGWDYKKFATNTESNIVEFGVDDVYIYDKDGKVYYVGGYVSDDGTYYTKDTLEKAGPEIVSVDKTLAENKKSVKLTILVKKINGGDLTVEVDGKEATRISEKGTEEKYEFTVYENKTHKIKATEEGQGTTTTSVEVTEIDAEVYTITYNANGGTNAPGVQSKTENVIMQITTQVPVRNGYIFLGWNENASETVATYKPGSEFTLNKNTMLYAIWTTDQNRVFSVMYNANGGDGAPAGESNLTGNYTIANETPTRSGYGFEGWSTDQKASTAMYHAGDAITLSENLVLYAVWVRGTKTVLVTVEPEGAGTVTGNGARLSGGEVYVSTTPAQGYTFKNWTVKSGGINLTNTTTTSTNFIMPDNDVELVANYEINGLTVRYNSNKGSTISKTEVVEYGGEIILTALEPVRHGYDFIGWALSQDAKTPEYHAGDLYTVFQNTVFYAVWVEHVQTYTITYDFNGGTGNKNGGIGIFTPQIKSQGGSIQVPVGGADEPFRLDFTFKGWALKENADEDDVVLRPGDTYYKDEDLTLYAVWKDEVAPRSTITVQQDEGSEQIKLIGRSHDEGIIAGYAWTMSDTVPLSWETEKSGTKDVEVEKEVVQKGRHYFWVKDVTGNYSVESIMIYEVKFDAKGGIGAPETQFQAEDVELRLSSKVLTRERYVFLGWSTSTNPGKTENDVEYFKGGTIKLNADVTLRAVWGETFFKLSANSGVSQIDGENIIITITKSLYTGNINVRSEDTLIATGTESNGILTIVPGTKVGETILYVEEDRTGFTEKVTVIINKGIRQLTINETNKTFVYGDSSAQIGFTYRGKDSSTTVISNNTSVAVPTLNGKIVTITPKNYGTAIVTIRIAEDDQYLERVGEIAVTVSKRELVITPASNQKKVYDGTAVTPTLTYSYKGNVTGEVPGFTGILERAIGVDVGKYEINKGTLALTNNGSFIVTNYTLKLSPTKVYFEITPKPITPPTAITPQTYDGTIKYGILSGAEYIRGGQYAQTNAGKYTAVATLADTKNFMWSDTNNTTAKNIAWEITSYNLTGGKIKVNPVSSVTYTGNEIRPTPTVVYDSKTTLVSGTDYTLSYSNNINVGTATITITGKGNYSGTITTTFQITKATMKVDSSDYTGIFDNQNHTISVKPTWPSSGTTIYYSTTALTSSNYTSGSTSAIYYKNVGTYTIYYYIINSNFYDYSGSQKVTINPKSIATSTTISGATNKEYTGSAITQDITVKENEQNRTLVNGTDYTVSYSNNVNVGTATVTITGKGNFTGTKTVNFSILGDTITINKSTNSLVSSLTVSMSKKISVTTLQYKIDNGSWTNYTGAITITKDCTVYGRSVHNGNTIGSNSITITNICEHSFTTVTCTTDSTCIYCGELKQTKLGHTFTSQTATSTYLKSAATCLNKAVYYHKCIRCAEKGTTTYEYGEPLGHSYTSQTATATYLMSEATCVNKAVYYYKCIRCSEKGTTTYEYGSALGHDFTVQLVTSTYKRSDATCTAAETYYYKCSRCTVAGTNYYSNGNALGHDYNTKSATSTYLRSDATCTAAATYYYKCDRCTVAGTNYYSSGNSLGHNFASQTQTSTYLKTAATCTANATYYYKCTRCTEKGSDSYTASGTALGHSWGSYSVTTDPTCTATGIQTRYCSRCGVSDTASVAALGHNYTAASSSVRSDATCTVAQTNWYKCSRCTSVSSSSYYSTGSALGHNYSAATCTKAATCTRCSVTTGSALGHSYSAATCTTGESCTRCGAAGDGALGHSWGSYSITQEATCTATGTKKRYCQRSGCSASQSASIDALGHNYGSWTTTSDPTCITTGSQKRTCSRCSDTQTQSIAIDSSSHYGPWAMEIVLEATCTTESKIREVCAACDSPTGYVSYGSALGHNYGDATCTTASTCSRCGGTTGSALGHSYSSPTCTSAGSCTRCGATGDPATGHSYGGYTTTKSATCTSSGTKVRYCSVCNASDSATIAKLGHSYTSTSTTSTYLKSSATCTSAAVYYYKCSRCSSKGSSTYTSGSALGHSYSSSWSTTSSKHWKACTRSGCSSKSSEASHSFNDVSAEGFYICTKCFYEKAM